MRTHALTAGLMVALALTARADGTHFEGPVDSHNGFTVDGVPLVGGVGPTGPTGPPGPAGPTMTGTDTDVCFVNGTNAVCTDNGFQWDTTHKRLTLNDGGRNTMIGDGAGFAPVLGGGALDNVLVGHLAGSGIDTAARNVVIGSRAGTPLNDEDDNVIIGAGAAPDGTFINGDVVIGSQAGRGARSSDAGSVLIGWFAGSTNGMNDTQNVVIGNDALASIDFVGNQDGGSDNVILGDNAAHIAAKLEGTVLLGRLAAASANLGLTHDIAIGKEAMENSPGGASDTDNIAIGYRALRNQDSSEPGSIAIGTTALTAQTDGGSNTAIGDGALRTLVHGFNNVAVGGGSGAAVGADQNTLVGFGSNVGNATIHDGTAVGQNAKANANGAVALGSETTCASADTVCLGSRTLDMNAQKITNVTDPTAPQGAATKAYVDARGFPVDAHTGVVVYSDGTAGYTTGALVCAITGRTCVTTFTLTGTTDTCSHTYASAFEAVCR